MLQRINAPPTFGYAGLMGCLDFFMLLTVIMAAQTGWAYRVSQNIESRQSLTGQKFNVSFELDFLILFIFILD